MANVTGIHGGGSHGKTSIIGSIIDYVWRTYGKRTRLISLDNTEVLEPYEHAKIVDIWRLVRWTDMFDALNQASLGRWPKDLMDPSKGYMDPTPAMWDDCRFVAFDGASHMGERLMREVAKKGYIGVGTRTPKAGQEGQADMIIFKEGDKDNPTTVAGNSRTHYAMIQNFMRLLIENTGRFPIGTVVWTFLTCKAEEGTMPIYGPQLPGVAATPKVQSWCSSLLHAHKTTLGHDTQYQLCFKPHTDSKLYGNVPFKANLRVPLALLDPTFKQQIQEVWDGIIPPSIDWTNDSRIADKYFELRKRMSEAQSRLIIESKGGQ